MPLYATGYVQSPGSPMVAATDLGHRTDLGPAGLPTTSQWHVGDLALTVTPVAFSPVLLEAGDGRVSRFPRAWCRFEAADGRTGHGWTEWNQPQPPIS
jgi:hypothetical protein